MYLFRGEFGCVLHTGDFRWEPCSERANLAKDTLLTALSGHKVDTLYLDNTYCNPSFTFPPRDIAAEQVIDIIKRHPDHDIVIGMNKLGKEELLLHISKALETKICIWPERVQTMHLLGWKDVFTVNTSVTKIRAIPCNSLTVASLEAFNKIKPTIGILTSGLPWEVKYDSFMERRQEGSSRQLHPFLYSVLYSDHSCFNEIKEFVELIQPARIISLVSSSSCCIRPYEYFGHVCNGDILLHNTTPTHKFSKTDHFLKVIRTDIVDQFKTSKREKMKTQMAIRSTCTSIRISRVSLVRRKRRGAKLEETDFGCGTLEN